MDSTNVVEPAVRDAGQQDLFDAATPWESAAREDRLAADVVVNRPLETVYTYLVPDEFRGVLGPGQRVRVPFGRGNHKINGFCVGLGPAPQTDRELKAIDAVIDPEPLLSPQMLELTRWISGEYLCGWGQVLESVVPSGVKNKAGTRLFTFFTLDETCLDRVDDLNLPAKQKAVVDVLREANGPLRGEEIAEAARCGTGPINSLRKKGVIRALRQRAETFAPELEPVTRVDDLVLNAEQARALELIHSALESAEHRTLLLHGVTGSGKTEIYMQAIREVVRYGRQAIVLVPEISLTPQTIRRFRSRFDNVAVLHSHLSDAERHWHWQRIASGNVPVVVGARSAVFAPTPHLGLIVIDEEHETSFKQDSVPRYHAREVARKRAEAESIPLVLGSATPTLESWRRVQDRQDTLLSLPNRVAQLPLPPVVVVDIRNDPNISRGAAIGRALNAAIQRALNDEGQVILLLNLRGFSPTMWCRGCGTSAKCPHCDITLTWHKDRSVALCHSCEYQTEPLTNCPTCGAPGMRYLGIGTQRLEQEVRYKFPEYRCLRMDSDAMKRPGSHDEALEAFRRGDVRILLGTQMIAKGLDFPNVTLVGVVNADTSLHQPDLRASERTFQLIAQVAGRTGRSSRGGRVYVQSASPSEPAIQKAAEHDYLGFVESELEHRRLMNSPPYSRLTRVILRGPIEAVVEKQAREMAMVLKEAAAELFQAEPESHVRILGPAPAPVAKLRGNYRYHFQLAAEDLSPIQTLWRSVADRLPHTSDVEYVVDVDPINMR